MRTFITHLLGGFKHWSSIKKPYVADALKDKKVDIPLHTQKKKVGDEHWLRQYHFQQQRCSRVLGKHLPPRCQTPSKSHGLRVKIALLNLNTLIRGTCVCQKLNKCTGSEEYLFDALGAIIFPVTATLITGCNRLQSRPCVTNETEIGKKDSHP